MTTTITIELTSDNPDSTWDDVLNCIRNALIPSTKEVRLKDTPPPPASEYTFESNPSLNYYNGVRGTAVIRVEPDVPTGLGAVVKAGSTNTLYTRTGADEWVSLATRAYVSDENVKGLLRNGGTVLFDGVEQ